VHASQKFEAQLESNLQPLDCKSDTLTRAKFVYWRCSWGAVCEGRKKVKCDECYIKSFLTCGLKKSPDVDKYS